METAIVSAPQLLPTNQIIIVTVAFITGFVLLLLWGISAWRRRKNDPTRRIAKMRANVVESSEETPSTPKLFASKERNSSLERFAGLLDPSEDDIDSSRLEMIKAGLYSHDAFRLFQAAKLAGALGGLALGFIYYSIATDAADTSMQRMMIHMIVPGLLGYYAPISYVDRLKNTRQEEIIRGFPDALDMMLVCVEGGQTMDQAIQRIGKELHLNYPNLADELEAVSMQIQAGKERTSAMLDFAERCDNGNITSFVNTVSQAQRYGTSLSEALRIYTFEMRDKRSLLAEEKANKLPSKMSIASLLLTLPPLMLILVVPPILNLIEVFSRNG